MGEIDPMDDSRWRWVLWHYRYDPDRHQRRNVTVAAFDNEAEFQAAADALHGEVSAAIDRGERDARESVSGAILHPGYHGEQRRRRRIERALSHNEPWRPILDEGPLPPSWAMWIWNDDGTTTHISGGESPAPPTST